jgi:hypothetical protein
MFTKPATTPKATFVRKASAVLALSALAASGCASARAARKPVDRPALVVPPPPPRVIEPADVPPEPVGDLPPAGSAAPRSSRPTSTKPPVSDSKPEAKSGGEQKAAESPPVEPAPPPTPAPPPAQLRTPQTADTSGAARGVRATIDTARGILNTVDYGPLSNERKKAYNDAKLFLQQAEDALKQANFAFAQGVANKAETLAKELAGR